MSETATRRRTVQAMLIKQTTIHKLIEISACEYRRLQSLPVAGNIS